MIVGRSDGHNRNRLRYNKIKDAACKKSHDTRRNQSDYPPINARNSPR